MTRGLPPQSQLSVPTYHFRLAQNTSSTASASWGLKSFLYLQDICCSTFINTSDVFGTGESIMPVCHHCFAFGAERSRFGGEVNFFKFIKLSFIISCKQQLSKFGVPCTSIRVGSVARQ